MKNKPKSICFKIYLLRHGEAVGGSCYRGSSDDPLSKLGWKQMHAALESFADFDAIVTSPLQRCQDFAERLSKSESIPLQCVSDFSEIHFGDWESKSAAEIWQHHPELFGNYLSDPLTFNPPNGEPLSEFSRRVLSAWNNLLANTQDQQNILLVAHGGTIRVILQAILGMPLASIMKINVPHACVTKTVIDQIAGYPVRCSLSYHGNKQSVRL